MVVLLHALHRAQGPHQRPRDQGGFRGHSSALHPQAWGAGLHYLQLAVVIRVRLLVLHRLRAVRKIICLQKIFAVYKKYFLSKYLGTCWRDDSRTRSSPFSEII